MKKRKDQVDDPRVVFNEETSDEAYERYKKRCYRQLILKALLAFCLGLIVRFLFGLF